MAYKDDVKNVTINGQDVTYYTTDAVKKHAALLKGDYWEQTKHHYVKINPGWYVYIANFRGHEWSKVAGIKTIDFAVPQSWFDANIAEIRKRGGAAWWYDRESHGEPLFFDQLRAMAMKQINAHAPKAASTQKSVKRTR